MKILLLSAYDASSHCYWRELLVDELFEFDWTVVPLPDRHFYWRVRSNALTYALQHRETLLAGYDLILATSMVDLCGLFGLLPQLSLTPSVLYFHENQFAYPVRKPSSNIINSQLVSVYSSMAADRVLFNSDYNRQSFISGATELFNKMPDGVPANVMARVASVSEVLPVPIQAAMPVLLPVGGDHDVSASEAAKPAAYISGNTSAKALEIVWNHRWEYDKQPEVFFAAMTRLQNHGVDFVLHVMGQSFRQTPDCFAEAKKQFGGCIRTWGYQPRHAYLDILRQADIVVSCALHDFQGLGMLEAISYGCVPVAPARVVYEEYIPSALLYRSDADDALEDKLVFEKIISLLQGNWPTAPDVARYGTVNLLNQYRQVIIETASATQKGGA